jgi:hypothetical protein
MTEPNKQEFVSASKDANKQPPAEAGQHSCKNSEAIKEGAVAIVVGVSMLGGDDMAKHVQSLPGKSYQIGDLLYTSQTTATQAAVAAAMRKCAEIANKYRIEGDGGEFDAGMDCAANGIAEELAALIPAEANAALDAYVQENSREIVARVTSTVPWGLCVPPDELQAIVRDVLNKPANGGGKG